MNFLLLPVGSSGDVHPFFGLGEELRRRGHRVVVGVSAPFRELAERLDLEGVELTTQEEWDKVSRNPDLWHPRKGFQVVCEWGILEMLPRQFELTEKLRQEGDWMVVNSALGVGGHIAAEKFGIPLATIHLQPAVILSADNSPHLPPMLLGDGVPRWFKRFQFWLGDVLMINRCLKKGVNQFRQQHGLTPVKYARDMWYSNDLNIAMFPEWYAPAQADWPVNTRHAGFQLWDQASVSDVDQEVEDFLAAGDPPILFTAGSAMETGDDFFAAASGACEILGCRGMLVAKHDHQIPAQLPPGVKHFSYIPFSQVFSRSAVVVHHGGVGTTAQCLAAGVRQLIMPMSHDQPDNARRIKNIGVGDWISRSRFKSEAVAAKLKALLDSPEVGDACGAYAKKMQAEDGLRNTANILEAERSEAYQPDA